MIRGFPVHILNNLTKFKELYIYAPDTTFAEDQSKEQQLDKAFNLGAAYALIGGFGVLGNEITVSTLLMDSNTKQVIWSKHYKKQLTGGNIHQIQDDIAASVATQLGQPYGVINRLEASMRGQRKNQSYSAYKCILKFFDYAQFETREKHLSVRSCLDKTLKANPQKRAGLVGAFLDLCG